MTESNEAQINQNRIEKSLEPNHLSWQDLIFISKQNWGLRHAKNINEAKKEMNEGIERGDAVSLSNPQNFIPPEILENPSFGRIKSQDFSIIAKFIPKNQRQIAISNFEHAVKNFLEDSFGFDINLTAEDDSTEQLLNSLGATKSAFLIAEFQGANDPYDISNYHGLGKCGKQKVAHEDVVGLLSLEDNMTKIINELNFSPDDLNSSLSGKKFSKIKSVCATHIWNKILAVVKEKNRP